MNLRTRLVPVGLCLALTSNPSRAADPLPSQRQALAAHSAYPATMPSTAVRPGGLKEAQAAAEEMPALQVSAAAVPQSPYRFTLEEAKQRALGNNKLLALAAMNIDSKGFATRATQADYFPQVIGSVVYFHFDQPLGDVLTTRGRPRLGVPPVAVDVNVFSQDSPFSTVAVAQPITALLKIRQGVKIARATEQQAQATLEKGRRELLVGVEQLYWGWLAAQRIRAGVQASVQGGELLAKTGLIEARAGLLEAKQALQAADSQIADIEEQLGTLLDLPPCSKFDLVEQPLPEAVLGCVDDAIGQALATSPEVHDAEQDIIKARAAVCAAKVDYLPNVIVLGGYANQEAASYMQNNFSYVGVQGSYTFWDWGKRKNTVREREMLIAMAGKKLQQTQDEVRDKTRKTYRDFEEGREVLKSAREMVQLRQQAAKSAKAPDDLLKAGKDLLGAEVALVKAEMNYRVAYAKLMNITGHP